MNATACVKEHDMESLSKNNMPPTTDEQEFEIEQLKNGILIDLHRLEARISQERVKDWIMNLYINLPF